MHDDDLRRRLRELADEASPRPGSELPVVKSATVRRRLMAGVAALVLVAVVAGLAGATTMLGNRDRIDPAPGPNETEACEKPAHEIAVYLVDSATDIQIEGIREELETDSAVESATFISKDAAFEEFKEIYADQPEFWENLPPNALPMSFRVSTVDGADVDSTARRFRDLPHVDAVRVAGDMTKAAEAAGVELPERCPPNEEDPADSTYVDEEDGVSVLVPPEWQVATDTLTPDLSDPREIISLGTAPMPAGGDRCDHQPEDALEAMTSVDAFVSVQERAGEGEDYPPRARAFEEALHASSDQFEVCGKPEYVETYWVPFRDAGRNFYLLAAFGNASESRRAEMWRVINSLDFTPSDEKDISGCEGMERPSTAVEYGMPLQPRSEGSNEVVPVVFPDGTTAELVYPAELSSNALKVPFDELRARPDPAGGPPGNMIRPQIIYGGVPPEYGLERIVDCLEGRDGQPVPVWSSKEGDLIVLRFEKWHVVVFNRRSNLEAWARHLHGEVTEGGWLVLTGGPKLPIGPENDPGDAPLLLYARDRIMNLWPLDCVKRHKNEEPELSKVGRQSFVSYCLEDVQIEVHVQGPQEFVEAVFNGLQVRNVNRVHPLNKYALFP